MKVTSEYAPEKYGKKMDDPPGEIRSFGFRLNGNFAKQKISRYMRTKTPEHQAHQFAMRKIE
jgi:hypothetical protein